jgi:hypothetical protein
VLVEVAREVSEDALRSFLELLGSRRRYLRFRHPAIVHPANREAPAAFSLE